MPWGDFDYCEHQPSLWIENAKVKNRRKFWTNEGCSIATAIKPLSIPVRLFVGPPLAMDLSSARWRPDLLP